MLMLLLWQAMVLGPTWVQCRRSCQSVLSRDIANYLMLLVGKGGRVV
jgi:hypothetical protein